ncbi:glycosyltransferase [Streptomyces lavendulae]|uniref:glycosyltransferase n=1 Tax=Streptomyces lavendulae TaxID=1914 RepID=UPI00382A6939
MKTVNLISRDNGSGLTRDMQLLTGLMKSSGYQVRWIDHRQNRMPACHVGIFLEEFNCALLEMMGASVFIPNMDCFPEGVLDYVDSVDQVWAKGTGAAGELRSLGFSPVTTGFMSGDMIDTTVEREDLCLHVSGKSSAKGTQAVLEAWRRHPDLPTLYMTAIQSLGDVPANVRYLGIVPLPQVENLMNRCRIHVLPSLIEGWGHGLAEGAMCGASVVTTDASPMNEHIRPEFGFLLPVIRTEPIGVTQLNHVDPDDIADAVRRAVALGVADRGKRSSLAREHVLARNATFAATATRLIGDLMARS